MKYKKSNLRLVITAFLISGLFMSCSTEANKTENTAAEVTTEPEEEAVVYDTGSPESMLLAISQACGGRDNLKSLNDVEYEYHYVHPDGTMDLSLERYIFEKEVSWAKYGRHEINVVPDLEGTIVQFYDGEKAAVYQNGEALDDPAIVGVGQFLRQANFMWFNMMFKFTDPGVIASYGGQTEKDGSTYDVLNVTYDPEVTGKKENDTFILYINPETQMVESFHFSLPAFGVLEPVLHAQLTYEEIDGIEVITHRVMTAPSPDGEGMVPMVDQQLQNIKFNNGFTVEQLSTEV